MYRISIPASSKHSLIGPSSLRKVQKLPQINATGLDRFRGELLFVLTHFKITDDAR